jgi:hypothetical protein
MARGGAKPAEGAAGVAAGADRGRRGAVLKASRISWAGLSTRPLSCLALTLRCDASTVQFSDTIEPVSTASSGAGLTHKLLVGRM